MKRDQPKTEVPQPMDPGAREVGEATMHVNHPRNCYAAATLAAEIGSLFPETPAQYSNANGRNVNTDVSFDLTALDASEASDLTLVLRLLDHDSRVREVIAEDEQVLVSFHNAPRTYDLRDSFNLLDALDVLDEPVDFMGGSR